MSLSILGTGSALPARLVTNDDLAQVVDTNDEWIVSRTGIRGRHVISGETLTELSVQAGRQALWNAGVEAAELDLILCSTIQGDYITPSLASLVQQGLDAQCPAFDLNAACCGFLYGLDTAHAYLASGKARHVLLISADQMSKHLDWADRSTCVLFGDGAASVVLGKGKGLQYIHVTSAGQTENLRIPSPAQETPFAPVSDTAEKPFVHMNGQNIFKFAVSACAEGIKTALQTLRLTADDIGHYLIHQANGRIVDGIRRAIGQPDTKFPTNIGHTANISSATIPCLLDELNRSGRLKRGEILVFSAAGAGLTTGECVLTWEK